jgi:hypothetical protein
MTHTVDQCQLLIDVDRLCHHSVDTEEAIETRRRLGRHADCFIESCLLGPSPIRKKHGPVDKATADVGGVSFLFYSRR